MLRTVLIKVNRPYFLHLGGNEYRVQCKVVAQCPHHYLGGEYEARNTEHFMDYWINETGRGKGIAEWNYRNTRGIPFEELDNVTI